MIRVYLAGPCAEMNAMKDRAREIEALGMTITEPWWERIAEAADNGWLHDAEVPADFMRESARRNQRGIVTADVVVVCAKSSGGFSSGAAGEIGYALARRKRVVLVGNTRGFVWSWLIDSRDVVASWDDALALLRALV